MNTLKAIIVEDEKNGQEVLTTLLEMYCPQVQLLGVAASVGTAYDLIKKGQPNLVFLDIILDQENSFDLLKMLQPITFQIIFTTSSEGFALDAFKANAVDYLMKPVDPNELTIAVDKVQKLLRTDDGLEDKFNQLLHSIKQQKIERISIPSRSNGIDIIELKDIIYIKGSGTYSTFHLVGGKEITASNNLGHYESMLTETTFVRTHQSFLVNISHIKRIVPNEAIIEVSSGVKISLSRSRRDELLARLG